jgi:AcrR family transcriptional regulator
MSANIKTKLQDVKRELILEEAATLFESIGYESLKVSDLAKKVGVSVGTIYGMFESKEELYLAYVKQQIASHVVELEARCKDMTPQEQLLKAFELKFEHFYSKRIAIEECAKNNPLFFSNIRHTSPDILEEVYRKIATIIQAINPSIDAQQAMRLSYAFTGLSDGYIAHWFAYDDDLLKQLQPMHQQMLLMIKGS